MNGLMVKNHISFKTAFGCSATRRTSFPSWIQACQRVRPLVLIPQLQGHLQDRRDLVLHLLQTRLLHQRHHQVIMWLEKKRIELKVIPLQCLCQVSMLMIERRHPLSAVNPITSKTKPTKNKLPKTNKKATMIERSNPMYADSGHASSEIPEWLQELWENLVDDEVLEQRLTRQFFSWSIFRAHVYESWGFG